MLKRSSALSDQTIALAAMAQAAYLATRMAMSESYDEHDYDTCLQSLLHIDSPSALAIYGDLKSLQSGLMILASTDKGNFLQDDFYRILWSFMRLARELLKDKVAQKFRSHLLRIVEQARYFGSIQNGQVLRNLSDLYLALANYAKLKLKMHGRSKNIQNLDKIIQIRVVLFAGVRATVLWYQLGGNIFKLFWNRKAYRKKAQEMLADLKDAA